MKKEAEVKKDLVEKEEKKEEAAIASKSKATADSKGGAPAAPEGEFIPPELLAPPKAGDAKAAAKKDLGSAPPG